MKKEQGGTHKLKSNLFLGNKIEKLERLKVLTISKVQLETL